MKEVSARRDAEEEKDASRKGKRTSDILDGNGRESLLGDADEMSSSVDGTRDLRAGVLDGSTGEENSWFA